MPDNIPDVRELKIQGDLNKLQHYFNEPTIKQWTVEMLGQLKELYELGLSQDSQDPVDWVIGFNQSNPIHLKVGAEVTRLGKILTLAKIYVDRKTRETTDQSKGGRKQIKREYD
jgi:hypothetical protein